MPIGRGADVGKGKSFIRGLLGKEKVCKEIAIANARE